MGNQDSPEVEAMCGEKQFRQTWRPATMIAANVKSVGKNNFSVGVNVNGEGDYDIYLDDMFPRMIVGTCLAAELMESRVPVPIK